LCILIVGIDKHICLAGQNGAEEESSVSEERLKPMANRAYEDLFQKIVYCEYAPGQEINEKQLVEETGFGRTPLR